MKDDFLTNLISLFSGVSAGRGAGESRGHKAVVKLFVVGSIED